MENRLKKGDKVYYYTGGLRDDFGTILGPGKDLEHYIVKWKTYTSEESVYDLIPESEFKAIDDQTMELPAYKPESDIYEEWFADLRKDLGIE